MGILIDAAASDKQAANQQGIFTADLGGPMAGLAEAIGELHGVERVPMTYEDADGVARARFGEISDVEVANVKRIEGDFVSLGNLSHPANSTFTIVRATRSHEDVFGIAFGTPGTIGLTAPLSWLS